MQGVLNSNQNLKSREKVMNTNITIKIPRFSSHSKIFELGFIFFHFSLSAQFFFKEILFSFAHLLFTLSLQKIKNQQFTHQDLSCTNLYRTQDNQLVEESSSVPNVAKCMCVVCETSELASVKKCERYDYKKIQYTHLSYIIMV